MTEPEDFLSRWSRRKREAQAEPAERPKREQPAAAVAEAQDAQQAAAQSAATTSGDAKPDAVFDISKLPSLDSIGPATDIRIFLQPGVPAALSRAALRRAWSADPTIRDFIGLSENSWDFTANDGMHGFGALDPADVKRVLAQLLGGGDETDESAARDKEDQDSPNNIKQAGDDAPEPVSVSTETSVDTSASEGTEVMLQDSNSEAGAAALQKNEAEPLPSAAPARRTHGRALPQ